jgi:hypothetical protein
MAHGDAREGRWRGNWQMEWVASTLHTTSEHAVPALLPLMRTPRLPVVDRTDAPPDLNGLVRFAERRNLVSARVPSHLKRSLPCLITRCVKGFLSFNPLAFNHVPPNVTTSKHCEDLKFANPVWHYVYKMQGLFRWIHWRLSVTLYAYFSHGILRLFPRIFKLVSQRK